MKLTPQITFHGVEPSAAVEAKALEYAKRLDRFADRIMGCRVNIEQTGQHHHKGRLYRVRIDLKITGVTTPELKKYMSFSMNGNACLE